MVKKFKCFTYW